MNETIQISYLATLNQFRFFSNCLLS